MFISIYKIIIFYIKESKIIIHILVKKRTFFLRSVFKIARNLAGKIAGNLAGK
jgi:hypothetical protein